MYTGPHLIKDNLVFGYDTGYSVADNNTSTRFYKGAPTINYIHNQNAVAQDNYTSYSATNSGNWNTNHPNAIRAYNAAGGDITYSINTGVGNWENTHHAHWQYDSILKKPVIVMHDLDAQWKAKSFGTGLGTWTSQGKTHGDTYTISWLQWVDNLSKNAKAGLYTKNSSGGNGFHDGQANSPSSYNTKLRTWQRVYQTYVTNSNRDLNQTLASIYMYGHYNVRATVKIADVQFTWGSTPFPFSAEYERSSTQSIIDLKRTASIDVSNVTFGSTGQPTFDGTDDRILSDTSINLSSYTSLTYEGVLQAAGIGTHDRWFSGTNAGNTGFHEPDLAIGPTGQLRYIFNGSGFSSWHAPSGLIIDTTKFNHLVYTFTNQGVIKIYINGVQEYTATHRSGTFPSNSKFMIGTRFDNNTEAVIGSIPIVRVYSKALTAEEVKQNFNAYKNRFGI